MALLFVDGFDHYATADILKKWSASSGGGAINSSAGRRSGGCLQGSNNFTLTKNITAGASFVMGGALSISGALANALVLFSLRDAGTAQCELRINTGLTLSVTRNGSALTSGTSALTLTTGAYYYIEWKVTIANSISAGSCTVKVNGVTWITVATSQDTQDTANASASQVLLGGSANISSTASIDDFYICDQSGSTNNDFLGDCRVDTLLPTADGTYSAFTPSTGTSHFALVDETAPNTSDYNQSNTTGQKDSYQMQNLSSATGTVYGVQAIAAVMKDDVGPRLVKVGVRSSSTDSLSSAAAPLTSQLFVSNILETNPATSTAWTETTVNNAEFLVECD